MDFFRGFFLILISFNHLLNQKSIIRDFTFQSFGWVTSAEAFVFISGLTAGLVYSYKFATKGEAFIKKSAISRAVKVYGYHLALFLFTMLVILSSDPMQLYWKERHLSFEDPIRQLLLGSVLLYQPPFLDILPMYALFLLLVPFAIKQFSRARAVPILIVSGLVYLVASSSITDPITNLLPGVHYGIFNAFCWQLLFLIGLHLGYLTYHQQLGILKSNKNIFRVAIFTALVFFVLKVFGTHLGLSQNLIAQLTDKGHLRPLRLLNFSAIAYIIYFISAKYTSWFTFRPVCLIGRYSLEVFSFHVVLVILFKPLFIYLNSLYNFGALHRLHLYPISTTLIIFVLLPSLYLVPMVFSRIRKKS
nr:OpgC domain-containing protein [Pedobacter sp. SYSU D00535]